MKITVIDNYDSFVYNLVRYLKEEKSVEINVMRNDQINFQILDQSDAILLSPGPGIPSEAGEMMQIIEKYHAEKSILGICLGHQALAEFYGASLENCENPQHGMQSEIRIIDKGKLFQALPATLNVGRYHSWRVKNEETKNLQFTSFSPTNEVMSLKHEKYESYGIQFHPESILTPFGRNIIRNWINCINQAK